MTIGRSRSCTVTLRDPAASRSHAALVLRPGDTRARDLQSSNGTYLNGERLVGERPVTDGDRITIGETDIVIHITAPVMMEEVGATVRIDQAHLQCPACGSEVPLHAEACPRCGHRMAGDPMGGATARFDPGMIPPAGAPGVPPAAAPPLAPPRLSRTEIYRDAAPVAPPIPEHTVRESFGGEVLPAIADEAIRPGPPPVPPLPPPPHAGPAHPAHAGHPGGPPAPPLPTTPRSGTASPHVAAAPGAVPMSAGFLVRAAAFLIDWLWMSALAVAVSFAFGGPGNGTGRTVFALAYLLLWLVVPLVMWATTGATPGKALLGLRVVTGDRERGIGFGRALLRLCGYMVSSIFAIGFLMVAFTKDHRALHDHLVGTMVVRR